MYCFFSYYNYFCRETNDNQKDTETIHTIKNVFYNEEVRYNDIAILELQRSVNDCTDAENQAGKCWPITPVSLPSPDLVIRENQKVRALGMICVVRLLSFSIFQLFSGWGIFDDSVAQSENLRQLDLTIAPSRPDYDEIQTNVGPYGEDVCEGDSGEIKMPQILSSFLIIFLIRRTSVDAGR